MSAFFWQLFHAAMMLALAPLVTGIVRLAKARLQGRQGPSVIQPYRDLFRLLRKEAVVADSASWLFRVAPYLIFTATWTGAAIVPAFTSDMTLVPAADLIALVAMLGVARFFTALAGMDIGTAFGGIGASREMMISSLAEPAMLMMTFSLSLIAGTTAPAGIAAFVIKGGVHLDVSLGLALIALLMVAIAENGRIPVDNPTTHLELTMVHEAMVLEYSGRHLALIEAAGMVRLLLFMTLIASVFFPWGIALPEDPVGFAFVGLLLYFGKLLVMAGALALFETTIAKMRVFRVADFLGGALLLALLATIFIYVSEAV
jgi:formate hydrogenlyase subunit 4